MQNFSVKKPKTYTTVEVYLLVNQLHLKKIITIKKQLHRNIESQPVSTAAVLMKHKQAGVKQV